MAKTARSWKEMRGLSGKAAGRAAAAAVERSVARAQRVGSKRATFARTSSRYRARSDTGPEVKYIDTDVNVSIGDSSDPEIILLNGVAQGSDNTSRIGRKFLMTALQYNLTVSASTTQLATASYVNGKDSIRVAVVYDKQANSAAPTVAQVWNVANNARDPMAVRNVDYIERFTVLCDDLVNINVSATTAQVIQRYQRLALPVHNDGTGATIADLDRGSLYLIMFDQNTSVANECLCEGKFRVSFTDM